MDEQTWAVANGNSKTVSIFANATPPEAAHPFFILQETQPTGVGPRHIVAVDLNTDGRRDLAVMHGGGVDVLMNRTAAPPIRFSPRTTFPVGEGPQAMAAGDFNGTVAPISRWPHRLLRCRSQRVDLAKHDSSGGDDAQLRRPPRFVASTTSWWLTAADLNGDGRVDLALTYGARDSVEVFLNVPVGRGIGQTIVNPTVSEPGGVITVSATGVNIFDGVYGLKLSTTAEGCPNSATVLGGNALVRGRTIGPVNRIIPTTATTGARWLCWVYPDDNREHTVPTKITIV
jgi:hypothetical protein